MCVVLVVVLVAVRSRCVASEGVRIAKDSRWLTS